MGLYERDKNYEEAIKYYTMAAEQGHVEAQNSLGEVYEGIGKVHWAFTSCRSPTKDMQMLFGG